MLEAGKRKGKGTPLKRRSSLHHHDDLTDVHVCRREFKSKSENEDVHKMNDAATFTAVPPSFYPLPNYRPIVHYLTL